MHKKNLTRLVSAMLAVVVALGLICFDTSAVSAASSWDINFPEKMWVGEDPYWVGLWKENNEGIATAVSSSKSSVVAVKKEKYRDEKGKTQTAFYVKPESVGTAKITIKFKTKSGKKLSTSRTVSVKKYPNHIKSLKVDGKTVNVSKNKYLYLKGKFKKDKVKINMKLKDGWKIVDVWGNCWDMDSGKIQEIKNAKSLLKKGSAIKFPKKYSDFELMIGMSKGDYYISYHVRLSRSANP